jgi:hypothetical protein
LKGNWRQKSYSSFEAKSPHWSQSFVLAKDEKMSHFHSSTVEVDVDSTLIEALFVSVGMSNSVLNPIIIGAFRLSARKVKTRNPGNSVVERNEITSCANAGETFQLNELPNTPIDV